MINLDEDRIKELEKENQELKDKIVKLEGILKMYGYGES